MLGRTYRLQRLEIIGGPQVVGAWPAWLRILLRGAGVHDFLWWHDKVSAGAAQRRVAATAAARLAKVVLQLARHRFNRSRVGAAVF
jgi:hypothetical protein